MRKPPKLHAREDSRLHAVALDAVPALAFWRPYTPPDARHLLARSEALDVVDARHLRQSRDRRPCLHDLASSTAVRQLGFVAQTKKPAIHRCLRPRSRSGRHSCCPVRAPVLAALHRRPPHGPSATAPPWQLAVDTRRPCTCNQRPSTRSHRTVDNSLITDRMEYSTFLRNLH